MKKLILIATLALAGCNEEGRKRALDSINTKLPEGCFMSDMGSYASIRRVLVVICDGAKTTSINTSWMAGKTSMNGVTVQIEEN
jgi:hypothetical protein